MSTLEQAAMAFDTDSGHAPASESRNDNNRQQPTEMMFGRIGELEVDENSPARGGGDDLPVEGEVRQPKQRQQERQQVVEEDEELEPEDDPSDDPEGDDPEGDEQSDDPEEYDDVYEVTIDGERHEVSLREALNGYVRTETFHQRLNEIDSAKQVLAREAYAVLEDRKKYIGLIEDMEVALEQMVPKEPDWDAEYARNPQEARQMQKRFDEYKAIRANLKAEKDKVNEDAVKANSEQRANYVNAENKKILANNPGWKDEKVMARDQTMMAETAMKAGFDIKEVQGMTDSRMVTILLKAAKYDKLQANRPKPIRRGTKPVTPGAGSKRTAPKGGDKAMRQLSRTGSVEAAAVVFDDIINPRRK